MNAVDALGITTIFCFCVAVGFMSYAPPPVPRYKNLNEVEA